ncbi:MAG: hypothetical protein ACI3ZK_01685 [Candidatus Cryptobacteroides sp.]
MKKIHIATSLLLSAALVGACVQNEEIPFAVETDSFSLGAEGGVRSLRLSSDGSWVAKTQEPWISVSPANGIGSIECEIRIDSALSVTPRQGLVRIERIEDGQRKDISISQEGFKLGISTSEPVVEIESYADYGKRSFTVPVTANTPFVVNIPEKDREWLKFSMPELKLDRGVRPRTVNVKFEWELNVNQEDRESEILFEPVDSELQLERKDNLLIRQKGAEAIEIGIKGDSLALIAINRSLDCYQSYNTAERMANWNNVEVWKSGPNKGRVRKAAFYFFATKESLPFQVRYLTAAEELTFFGNANTFLLDLEPGEFICELSQLKRLTIGAYGLVRLPENFKNLRQLEFLDMSGNNFQTFPEVLNKDNFPNLRTLLLNANMRSNIYDLSNNNEENPGGFIDECQADENGKRSFPVKLLEWDSLDTLRLSVNFLQGSIPSLEDNPAFPKWTEEEVNACDTLPSILIGLPKVLPNTNLFAINLNKLSGELPQWLLFHPKLDLWIPFSLVFPQEGKDKDGNSCGFSNEPANLDYYYKEYVNKYYNPNKPQQ